MVYSLEEEEGEEEETVHIRFLRHSCAAAILMKQRGGRSRAVLIQQSRILRIKFERIILIRIRSFYIISRVENGDFTRRGAFICDFSTAGFS